MQERPGYTADGRIDVGSSHWQSSRANRHRDRLASEGRQPRGATWPGEGDSGRSATVDPPDSRDTPGPRDTLVTKV